MTRTSGWLRLKQIVAEAFELPATERGAFLDDRCADPAEREEAERLLDACVRAQGSGLLATPAAEFAGPVIDEIDDEARRIPDELRLALAGRYSIEREIGRGGMATVYLAHDERHGRVVALKLLRPELSMVEQPSRGAARFQREIEIAAALSHPHIVPLHDSGIAAGCLYHVTPFVDGETLSERLRRAGSLPIPESIRILRDVARALSHAHDRGLVHRDIKPGNILLTRDGDALVTDFGVATGLAAAHGEGVSDAKLTEDAMLLGTPAYMSPEQVVGAPVDQRSDLYSLGVVAYELVCGAHPFAGRPRHELLTAHVSESPPAVSHPGREIPPQLASLIGQMLAKRSEDRPASAVDVLAALDRIAARPRPVVPAAARRVLRLIPAIGLLVLLSSSYHAPAAIADSSITAVPLDTGARGTDDREAYDLFQKGRHLVGTRQRDALLRSLAFFEAAIARDSSYARAHAALADAYVFLGMFGHMPPHEAFPTARAAAEHAIALEPGLVEARASLAHLMFVYEWNWAGAELALQRAIALDPEYPILRMYYASFLHSVGRSEEALVQLAIAGDLDPLIHTGLFRGRVFIDTGRPQEAEVVLREVIDVEPRLDLAHHFLAHAYLQMSRPDDAVASMRRAAALSGRRDSIQLAYVYAATGDRSEARAVLDRLADGDGNLDLLGFHLAMAYAEIGEVETAFRWLGTAYEERAGFMNLLGVAVGFEAIRSDPRFVDILRRMGLR